MLSAFSKRGRRAALAVTAVAVALGGCNPEDSVAPGPRATVDAPGSASPAEEPDIPTPAASDFAADAAVLRVAIPEPATLDPMLVQDPGSVLVARQLFEGLTRWDPLTRRVVPAAALSWDVERGGRRFVFKLRPGMQFHDGAPVTAQDFRFAFDRIARRSSGSDLAYTLDRVEGFVEVNQLGEQSRLPGLRVRDPLTLVVDLIEPFREFPAVLTHPGLVPVPRAAVRRQDDFVTRPVGNGPFEMLGDWGPGDEVVLGRFERFWEPPSLDGIRFIPFEDAAESWLTFREGDLHVSEVPVGQIEQAATEYGTDSYLPLLNSSYYGVNLDRKSLRDRRVRRAASISIDRQTIARDIFHGNMQPPRGIVPRGMPGFDEEICGLLCEQDLTRARKIVSDLPSRKRRLKLDYTRGSPHAAVAEAIGENLEAAGFRVQTRGFGFQRYLRRLRDGKHGLFRLGWIAEFPTPDVFLTSLFRSDSPDNHSGFSSPRVDRLLRRAHRTPDEEERLAAYRRAELLIMKELPVIPIGSFEIHWAVQPEVAGLQFDVMGGFDAFDASLVDD